MGTDALRQDLLMEPEVRGQSPDGDLSARWGRKTGSSTYSASLFRTRATLDELAVRCGLADAKQLMERQ